MADDTGIDYDFLGGQMGLKAAGPPPPPAMQSPGLPLPSPDPIPPTPPPVDRSTLPPAEESSWQHFTRQMGGVASLTTLPFRKLSEMAADKIWGLRGDEGGGTATGELTKAFGTPEEARKARGLIDYGSSLSQAFGVGEGQDTSELDPGKLLVHGTLGAMGLSGAPPQVKDSIARGVFNLTGMVLSDPTAMIGTLAGGGRLTGNALAEATTHLGHIIQTGIGLAALPGIGTEAVQGFSGAKDAYDRGDYATASQKALEALGALGLGGLVAHGMLKGGAKPTPQEHAAMRAAPAEQVGGPPAAPAMPGPPEAPPIVDHTRVGADLDTALVGGGPDFAHHPTDVLQSVVDDAREHLQAGGKLDPSLVGMTKDALAELSRRDQSPEPVKIPPEDLGKTLRRLGWTNDEIGSARPAEIDAALKDVGFEMEKPAEAAAAPSPGAPEFEAAGQHLEDQTTLDKILKQVDEKEGKPESGDFDSLSPEEVTRVQDAAREMKQSGSFPADLPENLAGHALDLYAGHLYRDAHYSDVAPPADLADRKPDFTRAGTRQWNVLYDADGKEIPKDTPPAFGQRLVSWAQGPPGTGDDSIKLAAGITNLRGEQHFLYHGRRLGDYDLPTSFSPLKQVAHDLGWREAGGETSSPLAQKTYARFAENRGIVPQGEEAGGGAGAVADKTEAGGAGAGAAAPADTEGPGAAVSPGGQVAAGDGGGAESPAGGVPIGRDELAASAGPPGPPGPALAGPPLADAAGVPQESLRPGVRTPEQQAAAARVAQVPPTVGSLALAPEPEAGFGGAAGGPPGPPGSSPTEPLTSPQLRQPIHAGVVKAAQDVMTAAGIPWDQRKFPALSDQIAYHLNKGDIPLTTLVDTLYAKNMTVTEFTDKLWRPAITDGAQRLAQLSNLSKRLAKLTGEEGAGEAGGKLSPGQQLSATRMQAVRGLASEIDASSALYNTWRRGVRIWKSLLVSQPSTTMHIAVEQLGRAGIGAIADILDGTLNLAARKAGFDIQPGVRPLEGLQIASTALNGLVSFGKGERYQAAKNLASDLLDVVDQKHYDRLFGTYASDISAQAKEGAGGVLKGVDKALTYGEHAADILNTLNRGVDYIFRRAVFVGRLDGELMRHGMHLADVIENHNTAMDELEKTYQTKYGADWRDRPELHEKFPELLGDFQERLQLDRRHISNFISEEMLDKATDQALEATFANQPKSVAGKAFVGFFNKVPGADVVVPFSRYIANASKYLWQWSPAGVFRFLNASERAKFAAGDFHTTAQIVTGSAMLLTAWQIRKSEGAGERWYEVKVPGGGGRTIDLRPYHPLSAYLFAADLVKRWKDNTLYRLNTSDVVTGLLSANLRGGVGLALLDDLAKSATSLGSTQGLKTAGKTLAGEALAGFLTPLQPLADLYAQFDADSRVQRDRRIEPFLGPIKSRIPGMGKTLPAAESPTREGPMLREFPLVKQLTGLSISDKPTPVEEELQRLQFAPGEIFHPTQSPEADSLVKHYMGIYSEDVIGPYIASDDYKTLSDAEKGVALSELLKAARKEAKSLAMSENPDLFAEAGGGRMSMRMKMFMAEQEKEQEAQAAGGPPLQ